ncbi:unnamed protein product [Pleuronectes platessa]|uniref:Uncharacterized protein n=1 Tax=Pleuronectes platessa TaxID=8262 RepID=A0A9N7U5W4_PLEPL|nr:unnamed protein product [Pleuronectes platessa]
MSRNRVKNKRRRRKAGRREGRRRETGREREAALLHRHVTLLNSPLLLLCAPLHLAAGRGTGDRPGSESPSRFFSRFRGSVKAASPASSHPMEDFLSSALLSESNSTT